MATETVNIDASALRLPAQAGQGGKFLTTDGTNPSWATAAGTGDVTGPASSTDGNIVLMNGATGKVIKDSGLNISEIIEEDPGAGVGLIESGAGVSPIVLKNLKGGQGTQSVSNTGSVQVDIHFTAANKYHYSDASGDPLEGDITAAGRNLLDDADASAQRSTIGLSNVPNVDATNPANITQDTTHRFTTDTEKATWNALIGGSVFQTTWNATTNSPALVSSTGTSGHYYIVSVAGSTNLDGITDWKVGDWAIFDGSVWRKVDNTDAVSSVNSLTGAVVLDTSNVSDTSNKRYVTDAQLVVIGNTSGTNTGDQTNISGNAATVTTNANLTGPVTSVGNATAIADAALSIAKTSGLQAALDAKGSMFTMMFLNSAAVGTWTNMPAAEDFFQGSGPRSILPLDLSKYTQCRIFAYTTTAGFAGSKLIIRYKTTSWSATVGDYSSIGTSEISCTIDAATTFTQSAWIDLAAGAKSDIFMALTGSGGNGVIDPSFNIVGVQFRTV